MAIILTPNFITRLFKAIVLITNSMSESFKALVLVEVNLLLQVKERIKTSNGSEYRKVGKRERRERHATVER